MILSLQIYTYYMFITVEMKITKFSVFLLFAGRDLFTHYQSFIRSISPPTGLRHLHSSHLIINFSRSFDICECLSHVEPRYR